MVKINTIDKELLKLCYEDFKKKKPLFDKMYSYYKGDTDAMEDYKMITSRSNSRVNVNFFKKLLKEEVSYSIGNDINYVSKSGNAELVETIEDIISNSPSDHDIDLFKDMLIYSHAYELYSFDNNGDFKMHVLTSNEAYLYENEFGEAEFFMHIFTRKFTDEVVIKVYTATDIIYCNESFDILEIRKHNFKSVPVGFARVSDEMENDSLYKDIKGLQDAYEIVMSDSVNEISDFRNAYLILKGLDLNDDDLDDMKKNAIMMFGQAEGDAKWLIKEINDDFIQNTLENIEQKIYEVTNHINFNEKMNSNTSAVAMKTRLTALTQKCELQQKAFSNCVQTRIKFILEYSSFLSENNGGDWKDIQIKFTPNLPSDDLATAQLIQILDGKVSNETLLSLLDFVESPQNEQERLEREIEREYGNDLLEMYENVSSGLDE